MHMAPVLVSQKPGELQRQMGLLGPGGLPSTAYVLASASARLVGSRASAATFPPSGRWLVQTLMPARAVCTLATQTATHTAAAMPRATDVTSR